MKAHLAPTWRPGGLNPTPARVQALAVDPERLHAGLARPWVGVLVGVAVAIVSVGFSGPDPEPSREGEAGGLEIEHDPGHRGVLALAAPIADGTVVGPTIRVSGTAPGGTDQVTVAVTSGATLLDWATVPVDGRHFELTLTATVPPGGLVAVIEARTADGTAVDRRTIVLRAPGPVDEWIDPATGLTMKAARGMAP
jgi:hypothetical protein